MTLARFINEIGFKVKSEDIRKVNDTISDVKATATKLLGAIGIGFSLSAVNSLVEEFSRIKDQIRNSTSELGDQAEIQREILAAASATRSAYTDTAKVVSNLVHENSELFGSIDEAIKFNNAATMLFKSAGKTNEDIAGLMEAINKSFAKGYVDSETLSQLLERSPEAVELLNKQLGTTSDQLEQMATDGKFTVEDLKAAFVDNADAIAASFGNVKMTVTDALTVIRNKWGLWLADTNEMLGITGKIGSTMTRAFDTAMRAATRLRTGVVWLSEKVGGLGNLVKLVALISGTLLTAMKLPKILSGLEAVGKVFGGIKPKTLGIVAAIVLLALLIDDFINFMQGNDSLLGTMLEKAGVDCDALRETIKSTWSKITAFLSEAGATIKRIAGAIGLAISTAFKIGGSLVTGFVNAINKSVSWLKEHETALGLVAIAFGALTAAIAAYNIQQKIKAAGGVVEIAQLAATAIGVEALTAKEKAHAIATKVATTATTAYGTAVSFLTSPITIVIAVIAALIAIGYLLVKNWDSIKEFAIGLWQKIVEVFTNIGAAVKEKVSGIKESIVEGLTAAIDWIKSLPAQALTWGADIIQGIVDGIKGAIGKVGEAVSGVAEKIKSFLGFSEPEDGPLSNFHTYMPDMMDLMKTGIEENKGKVIGAIKFLAEDMSILASGAGATPATAETLVSNNSTRTIVLNNTFHQQFTGDKAAQKQSATAMETAADDITGQLARGLAYAR